MFLPRNHSRLRPASDISGNDPLSLHEERLAQMIANHTLNYQLIDMLHEITSQFQNDARYRNDPRYLKLWMMYASLMKSPVHVYQWLQDRRIGEHVAIFYEGVARYYIRKKRVQDAEKILRIGLSRRAKPIQRLQRMHDKLIMQQDPVLQYNIEQNQSLQSQTVDWQVDSPPDEGDRCETEDEDEDDEDDLPVHLPLPDILAWIDARIAHGARVAILQECYRYRQETSFEELRSRQYRPRRLAPPPRSKKQQKKPDRFTPASCSAAGVTPTVEDASLIVSVPLHPDLIEQKLAALAQSASDYHDLSSEHARSLRMRIDRLASRRATGFVTMGQVEFQVLGKLGEGGAAHLYLVRQAHGQEQRTEVLKVETPANPWEAYVLQQLATRLADPNRVIAARGCFVYQDSSFLLLDYASQGTLLDALNRQRQIHGTQGMPEPLAMLLTAELCRSLLAIHACGIVHGDLKLDNVVLAVDPAEQPHHQRQQRLKLIDFGRAIDLTLFPAGVRLLASWEPDTTDAQQIRRGEPWAPWTIDYWNTAAMAHWLLFGQPIKTAEEAHETRLQQPLKRYWQRQAWHDFFHCMLNPPQSPMTTKIEHIIDTFDHCLHAERTKTDSRLHMLVSQLQTATTKA